MALSLKHYSGFRKIAEGGMSELFRAVERSTGKKVVIKKLVVEQSDRAFTMDRCENEAKNASMLTHENIISIIDYGEDRGSFYIVMEHIDGCNLDALLANDACSRDIGLMIVNGALQALRFAHKKGVVHCDVKPANILIDRNGRVVLSDFGLSHARAHALTATSGNRDFTTPLFMPPEQAKVIAELVGLASDAWAETASIVYADMSPDQARALRERGIQWDLWSVGVLLYRICTGKYPFNGNDLAGLITSIVQTPIPKVRDIVSDVPPQLASVIERCLEKEPYRRPHSLDPVIDALKKHFIAMDISNPSEMIAGHMASIVTSSSRPGVYGLKSGEVNRGIGSFTDVLRNGLSAVASLFGRLTFFLNPRSRFARPMFALLGLVLLVLFGTLIVKEQSGKLRNREVAGPVSSVQAERKKIPADSKKNTRSTLRQRQPVRSTVAPARSPSAEAKPSRVVQPSLNAPRAPVQKKIPPEQPPAPARQPERLAAVQPPKPAAIQEGVIKITVDPVETKVFLDGDLLVRKEMAAGKRIKPGFHDILAQAPGFETYQRSFLMESNKTQTLAVTLKPQEKGNGRIHVYSYPWSDLYIDGAFVGTTPTPTPITLIEGTHKIMLKREGYRSYNESVEVKKDEVTRIQVQLERREE
jgi:serine/threonine protein kinase